MSSLETRQAELQSRLSQIDAEISKLDADFTQLAASWSGTDGAASMKAAEQIEQRLNQLRREKAITIAAQGHVTREQLTERDKEAEQARKALMAKAREISAGVITLNDEIDQALVQLRQLFERRFGLLSELAATGIVDSGFVTKLQGKSGPTRAFCASGLHRFVAVEKVGQTSFVPLASVNSILIGIGKDHLPPAGNGGEAIQPLSGENDGHVTVDGSNGGIVRCRRNGGDAA
jgi:hypothetical protein